MRYLMLILVFLPFSYLLAQGYLQNDAITTHTSGITLNEICADPGDLFDYNADGVLDDKDEFIEIVNSSDQTINIGGWTLSDNTENYHVFSDPTNIPPGKAIIVFCRKATVSNFNPGSGNLVVSTSSGLFQLANTNDAVGLKNTNDLYISVKWGTGTLPTNFTSGATLVGSEVNLTGGWNAGQSKSRNPDYSGSWNDHPTINGTVNWSNDSPTVTITNPQASPGRKYGQDQSLPVTLTSFEAFAQTNGVLLTWHTESEVENLGFEIFRSLSENGQYSLIDSYLDNPELKGQGNSSVGKTYHYTDQTVQKGTTYYYKLADVSFNGQKTFHGPIKVQVTQNQLNVTNTSAPKTFKLYPNHPNPFNPSTEIVFDLPADQKNTVLIRLDIYNINGQKVRNLLQQSLPTGKQYQIHWDGKDDSGNTLPAGIYFGFLKAGNFQQGIKMCLVK